MKWIHDAVLNYAMCYIQNEDSQPAQVQPLFLSAWYANKI